jgi:hypothetical protein
MVHAMQDSGTDTHELATQAKNQSDRTTVYTTAYIYQLSRFDKLINMVLALFTPGEQVEPGRRPVSCSLRHCVYKRIE